MSLIIIVRFELTRNSFCLRSKASWREFHRERRQKSRRSMEGNCLDGLEINKSVVVVSITRQIYLCSERSSFCHQRLSTVESIDLAEPRFGIELLLLIERDARRWILMSRWDSIPLVSTASNLKWPAMGRIDKICCPLASNLHDFLSTRFQSCRPRFRKYWSFFLVYIFHAYQFWSCVQSTENIIIAWIDV